MTTQMTMESSFAYMSILSGVVLSLYSTIPWVAVFLLTKFAGIRLYTIHEKELSHRVQRRLTHTSTVTDGDRGTGVCVGRWYYASMTKDPYSESERYTIWMIATTATYERLTREEVHTLCSPSDSSTNQPPNPTSLIQIFDRRGCYKNAYWRKRTIAMDYVKPRADQEAIMKAIQEHQAKHKHTVALIHGPPGTGKSMLGPLLAAATGGSVCSTFQPWRPGDSLAQLYSEAEPTAKKPLVITMDEIDAALITIHNGISLHKHVPMMTPNKAGWNHFLDTVGRGMFPHLILILTMNCDPEFIQSLDSSYIRPGRVDMTIQMKEHKD